MNDDPMIDVRRLNHVYRHGSVVEPVLHDLDLRVGRGEFVVVMGPSGCGKTTLLNVLGLMMAPTGADSVRLAGVETLGLSDSARTRLRRDTLGFIFQRFNLLSTLTVRRNVSLALQIRDVPLDGQVERLIERVGLTPYARKRPGQLSMGQQQRVAVARALVGQPDLLLADEPTGSLDSANAGAILDLLSGFHRELGQTVVMITHNERLAVAADRVLHMRDGRFVT